MMNLPQVRYLALEGVPIFEQLQLEEALLRAGQDNYVIINHKSTPAIVMGISGKKEELVEPSHYAKNPVPIIRRFSGGGCVLVGEETLFLTFIFNRKDADIGTCPKMLLEHTEMLLKPAFRDLPFQVRENDYVLDDKKFGGNAQYFTKTRWLHHTSLLWDYCPDAMQVLKMPPKIPEYRNRRSHGDFLCRLNQYYASKDAFFEGVIAALGSRYSLQHITHEEVQAVRNVPHRKATEVLGL